MKKVIFLIFIISVFLSFPLVAETNNIQNDKNEMATESTNTIVSNTSSVAQKQNLDTIKDKTTNTNQVKQESAEENMSSKQSKIAEEFVVDDFQNGVNYDNWWFGSGTYGKIYIKPVPYMNDNIVCEIDYTYNTINDDRIWLAMNKMLSINDVRKYDVLHIKVISGGYGGQFTLALVDSKGQKWVYVNNDILVHKQEIELNIPLRRFMCPVDLSSLSSIEIGISYAGNLLAIPYSGKCWIDDIKFIKYNK